MEPGPSLLSTTAITISNEDVQRWPNRRLSSIDDEQRVAPDNYEEIKKLILLAGIFFMVAVLFFLMKLEVPVDEIFKWSPIVWLIGVLLCCLLMNFLCFCRKVYKRRQLLRLRHQQELLLSLNLATSFPCLAPPPHDAQCCGGRGVLWSNYRGRSNASLPSYAQALVYSTPLKDSTPSLRRQEADKSTADDECEMPPPAYDEAIQMLRE